MSQWSAFGSQMTQTELVTNGEIFDILRGKDPVIYPSNEQYAEHVRSLVLSRMNIDEDHLSSSQYLGFRTDINNFVDNVRRRWKNSKGVGHFLTKHRNYLKKEVTYKVRVRKPKKVALQQVKTEEVKIKDKGKKQEKERFERPWEKGYSARSG